MPSEKNEPAGQWRVARVGRGVAVERESRSGVCEWRVLDPEKQVIYGQVETCKSVWRTEPT